jgi:hypothetical protein
VLHVLPTGGGKTVELAFVVAHAAAKGNRVILPAHRQEIGDQISLALAAMDVAHGRIQPGYGMTTDLMRVGMVQTVARRLDVIPKPVLIVIDEAHHVRAGRFVASGRFNPRHGHVISYTDQPTRDCYDIREVTHRAAHLHRYSSASTGVVTRFPLTICDFRPCLE